MNVDEAVTLEPETASILDAATARQPPARGAHATRLWLGCCVAGVRGECGKALLDLAAAALRASVWAFSHAGDSGFEFGVARLAGKLIDRHRSYPT